MEKSASTERFLSPAIACYCVFGRGWTQQVAFAFIYARPYNPHQFALTELQLQFMNLIPCPVIPVTTNVRLHAAITLPVSCSVRPGSARQGVAVWHPPSNHSQAGVRAVHLGGAESFSTNRQGAWA